jgi:hypothetical protein
MRAVRSYSACDLGLRCRQHIGVLAEPDRRLRLATLLDGRRRVGGRRCRLLQRPFQHAAATVGPGQDKRGQRHAIAPTTAAPASRYAIRWFSGARVSRTSDSGSCGS